MATGKKPAIQANQGHPGGLVDDFLIPVAKKIIRKSSKSLGAKRAAESKILSNRHETLMAKRRSAAAQSLYGKTSASRAVGKARYNSATKKSTTNLRSASRTAQDYGMDLKSLGLPTSMASAKGARKVTRSSVKRDYPYTTGSRMDKKAVQAMRKDKLAAAKRNKKGK